MSEAAIARLREIYDAFAASGEIDRSNLHPEVVFSQPEPQGRTERHGPDGYVSAIEEIRDLVEGFRFVVDDVIEAGDRLVGLVRIQGRARMGGMALDIPVAHIVELRDGLIVRLDAYLDRAEGLRVAGIPDVDSAA